MKLRILILLLLLAIQMSAFDFVSFQEGKYEFDDAKKNIDKFEPQVKVDEFKKEIVLHYCNFFECEKSLDNLESALKVATQLDSLGKIEASNFMRILSQDKGMQDKVFPKKLTYEQIKEHEDYVISMLRLRTEICCELENVQLLVKETLYLMHFRNAVFKRKLHDDELQELIEMMNKKKTEITPLDFTNTQRNQ